MNRVSDWLVRAGECLGDAGRRAALRKRLRSRLRASFACACCVAVVFLLLIEWVGERNLFTVFFLFLPVQIWLIPLGLFGLVGMALVDLRLLGVIVAAGFALVWFYFDWETSGARAGQGGRELVVMTFNRGQRVGSLQPFKERHGPDIIAFQEAGGQSRKYLKSAGYGDLGHGEDIGEFALLSRFPIKGKELLEFQAGGRGHRIAAKFVVDFGGEEIVIYNVHMNTPREELKAFRRGAFLRGLWPFSEEAEAHQRFWDCQIEICRLLLDHIGAEARPVLVVGDFNTPDRGFVYRQICRRFQDAHEVAGTGFGWTFPGKTRNPLTLFGPWLRIDHQFADESWRVLGCEAESGRASQHLAVVARYERLR